MRLLRAIVGFLLALHALSSIELAYGGRLGIVAVLVASLAGLLSLAGPGPARDRPQRDRAALYRIGSLWSLYSLYVGSAFVMVSSGKSDLALVLVAALAVMELVFLGWPVIGPRAVPLLVNSLALVAIASTAGGLIAVFAVGGHAPLVAAMLVVDQHEKRRAGVRECLRPTCLHAGAAMALVWPLLVLLPRGRIAAGGGDAELVELDWTDLAGGFAELISWSAFGIGAIFAMRWLWRKLQGEDEAEGPQLEQPAAEAGASVARPQLPPLELDLRGARGRIVRVFEDFLARAGKLGFERRPNWTASEYARRLPMPASRLARAFGRARYSDEELFDRDAEAATADAESVLARLKET